MPKPDSPRPADRFIELYNELDCFLKQVSGVDATASFSVSVKAAARKNASIRRRLDVLRSYGDLRNLIVHGLGYPSRVIAEPSDATLRDLEALLTELRTPRCLLPAFRRRLEVFAPESSLAAVLKHMRAHDFSQAVVRVDSKLSLLSVEGIAGWVEASLQDDIISVVEAKVEDAIRHELPGNCDFLPARAVVDEAFERFSSALDRRKPRVFAIIITENGRNTEKPLGIITPWDLLAFR